jgi:putative membrane protein
LIPHVLLATAVVPLALTTISRGLKMNVAKHKPLARVTLPIWLFVSVSGVLVYLMLYQM